MCSPFFCNHVISTPFDGVSSRRNLRKLFFALWREREICVRIDSTHYDEFYTLFRRVWNVLERYGFFRKSKARVTKHDDQSKQHNHEGANLDQSSRSERFIVEKCPMRCESIGSREFDEHSESEFLVSTIEALRKNLAPECNVKRSGGLILDTSQMTGRVSAGYHEKGRHGSHVKRIITVREEPVCTLCSTSEMSRVECGLTQGVQDCTSECPRISPTV